MIRATLLTFLAALTVPTAWAEAPATEPKSLTASINATLKPQVTTRDGRLGLGFSVGSFLPTGQVLKDAFGTNRFTIGFRPVREDGIPVEWGRNIGVEAVSARKGDNRLFLVPVTIGYARLLGDSSKDFQPFLRAGVGFAYFDYAFDRKGGGRTSAKRFGPAGNIELGMKYRDVLRLSATYHIFPEYDNTRFDGLELSATFTVLRF